MNLADYVSVLSAGEKIDGCQLAPSDAVAFASLHFPSRAYCLVADWARGSESTPLRQPAWVRAGAMHRQHPDLGCYAVRRFRAAMVS